MLTDLALSLSRMQPMTKRFSPQNLYWGSEMLSFSLPGSTGCSSTSTRHKKRAGQLEKTLLFCQLPSSDPEFIVFFRD